MRILGAEATLSGDDHALARGLWQDYFLNQYQVRIGGGTDEVQKNTIGERVLGLPREPSNDTGGPLARSRPVVSAMATARTIAVTGSASGMGAATERLLTAAGDRVIGIDLRDAGVEADLGTWAKGGRRRSSGSPSSPTVRSTVWSREPDSRGCPAARVVVDLGQLLRHRRAAGGTPRRARHGTDAAGGGDQLQLDHLPARPLDEELIASCLAGDEEATRTLAGDGESLSTYPVTKTALVWVRRRRRRRVGGPASAQRGRARWETPLLQEGRDHPLSARSSNTNVPLGRNGRPEEIAALVEFLLGPDARFFCGSILFCDGGTDAMTRADDIPPPWNPT